MAWSIPISSVIGAATGAAAGLTAAKIADACGADQETKLAWQLGTSTAVGSLTGLAINAAMADPIGAGVTVAQHTATAAASAGMAGAGSVGASILG